MTWWVRIEVSCGTSASTALSVSAGTAWNAGFAGARTVMSCWLFSESTRLAALTAWTSVDRAGLLLAAVATGDVAMPAKLPAPSAGTWAHAAPNGWPMAALLEEAAELLVAWLLLGPEALLGPAPELQAGGARGGGGGE